MENGATSRAIVGTEILNVVKCELDKKENTGHSKTILRI